MASEPIDSTELYKSRSPGYREIELEILDTATVNNIVPESIRFSILTNKSINEQIIRGVIKTMEEDYYYLHKAVNQNFRLIKADSTAKLHEAVRLSNSCKFGCDFKKSMDEDEDEEKAMGQPGGGGGQPPAAFPEAQGVQQAPQDITTNHPGGTIAMTPDHNEERWHGAQKSLDMLKSFNSDMNFSKAYPISGDKEKQFMREVLGKTPNEINSGTVYMSPTQRAQFSVWLQRSLTKSLNNLETWTKKR